MCGGLDGGEDFVAAQVAQAGANRDAMIARLSEFPQIRLARPDGAFYLFFAIDGMRDSLKTTFRLIDEAKIGFAPGYTFGPGGEGHLRMCYLSDLAKLEEAMDRFGQWLKVSRPD